MNGYLNAKGLKALSSVLLLGGALLLSGCPGDDDDESGPGGRVFPGIPGAVPAFGAMTVAINASGGAGAGATNDGGQGGNIEMRAQDGRILPAGGGDRSGIDNNFLPAAGTGALTDNVLTYTELAAINPNLFSTSGGEAQLGLTGQDFYLPAGAT
ncbi:MAG: hypothetical protein IT463_08715, partial [Planctomycetes bacterium]|nr:hypothetical protein [Planctomycetota bacterium]